MLNRKRNNNIEDIEIEVNQWREENRVKVETNLFPGEQEYLVNEMDCDVLPILYEIKDNHLENVKNCPNFVKKRYDKKTKRILRLKKREKKLLDSKGIEYEPCGYIVYLWKNEQEYSCSFFCSKKDNLWIYINIRENQRKEEYVMTVDERKSINTGVIQNLILENRGKLSISGVNDVLSFDDQVVMVETELGLLTVKGENIRINKLSIDTSEVIIEGDISYLAYSDKDVEKNKGNLISKIFK